jgi:hypothetical protein
MTESMMKTEARAVQSLDDPFDIKLRANSVATIRHLEATISKG